jgi:hypothetical protein
MNLRWTKKKPIRWKECILLTATWMNYTHPGYWDYTLFTVKLDLGENSEGENAWYWAIFKDDDEWGDLADLKADKYCILPLLKPIKK